MSQPAKMIDCPQCSYRDLEERRGTIRRYIQGTNKFVIDTCDKCGGSGRIPETRVKTWDRKTQMMKKKQRVVMNEWIALEQELVYGVKINE
jgi:hypothetical protein